MDFLLEEGIQEDIIQKMLKKYDESIIDLLKIEQENVLEVIHYFREIGVNQIDLLLLSHIEIFTRDIAEIEAAFSRYDLKTVVDELNNDITVIDFL